MPIVTTTRAERPRSNVLVKPPPLVRIGKGRSRPHDLFQKCLEHGRHGPKPQRKYKDNVLRPDDRLGRVLQLIGNRTVLELLHCPQHRKIDRRQIDPSNGVPSFLRALAIGPGETAAKAVRGRVGMADHNQDASRHGLLPVSLTFSRQGRSTLAT